MQPYRESHITRVVLILFFLVVLVYAYFEARGLLFGPTITVAQSTITTSDQYIDIQGSTQHISDLKMNGGSIAVTEDGHFDQPYVLMPGYNRVVLDARDKYGKTTQKVIEIVYTGAASSTADMSTSTSTPASATSTTPRTSSSTPAVAH